VTGCHYTDRFAIILFFIFVTDFLLLIFSASVMTSFENMSKFRYLGTTQTNQNDIRDEIKSRLNSGNASYYTAQNLLSSRLMSKKTND
jgi:hypothetical protein